jgi:hypothetical protein
MGLTDCAFCAELKGSPSSVWNQLRDVLPANRILHKANNWVVMPPLGSFAIGGLLFVSNRHIPSCAELNFDEARELDALIQVVTKFGIDEFKTPYLFFEHGPGCEGTKGACCVDHAHINAFPFKGHIWDLIPDMPAYQSIQSMSELSQLSGHEYLCLRDGSGKAMAYKINGIPSQYIRTIVTKYNGYPERWHWRDYLGLQEIAMTISIFSRIW